MGITEKIKNFEIRKAEKHRKNGGKVAEKWRKSRGFGNSQPAGKVRGFGKSQPATAAVILSRQ